ncbi:glycosyltransferase family 2 protein [Candidatus Uhrbacteria bacterium]|nr:glycosyltransferase family 2 protein [Candidatus Uhrbacteria bacterium]
MAKLSVHLVAWNGAKYIPYLFESLRRQTYRDWELLAIDNNSTDGTADLIEREIKNLPVPARLVRNEKNLGFAGGHNQAVRLVAKSIGHRANGNEIDSNSTPYALRPTPSEYIQLLNQDMYLAPDYLEKVVAMMDGNPEAGAGQGTLLKWDFSKFLISPPRADPHREDNFQFPISESLTNIIDTMGLKVLRNRRVVDWRTGEQMTTHNAPQPPLTLRGGGVEVFGVSGALPIYRRKAVDDVAFEGSMFDDEFGSYKEDVDLAFRLRSAGWKAYVTAEARAWHDRTATGPQEMSDSAAMKNRKGRAAYVNYYSYRNHLTVLLKNEHRANFGKDWPWILGYELKKFVYLIFTDWGTLKGLREVKKLWPRTMAKRCAIMANYKVKPEEMRRWFLEK